MAFPFVVLACAVTLSLSAQVVEAERSPIGWIAAAIPALGFLVMVKIALGHTSTTATGGLGTAAPSAADDADAEPPSQTVPDGHTPPRAGLTRGRDRQATPPPHRSAQRDLGDVTSLLPAARRAAAQLAAEDRTVTREALADKLRAAGYAISNARASALVKSLKTHTPAETSNDGTEPARATVRVRGPPTP